MALHKPSAQENEYFARRDAEKRHDQAIAQAQAEAAALQARLRAQPVMHCPRCGGTMAEVEGSVAKAAACGSCRGIFLDAADLDAVHAKEGYLTHLLREVSSRSWQ